MKKIRNFFFDSRTLAALALVAIIALVLFADARMLRLVLLAAIVLLLLGTVVWFLRKRRLRRGGSLLDNLFDSLGRSAVAKADPATREEVVALRDRMREAIKEIKSSRLGQTRGSAALYALPWYMIIGNPAAGKSTAIINSGLKFPFSDNRGVVIQGIGGTRNCDWYLTTEGVILDTAGRYSVSQEHRLEWLSFLDLLRKCRPKAPINGIIIAASIAELTGNRPEFAINLAKSLRKRVQELTERLEIHAPVYVIFTKADLIAGFSEFFKGLDATERERVWGATLPYSAESSTDAVEKFDEHFDELAHGLKEMSLSQMALSRGQRVAPGLLTLPLEFAAVKPSLRAFIATLFEDNPYQFQPVFRGFYFTSAVQQGASVTHTSERVAQQFSLQPVPPSEERFPHSDNGFFLQDLFRKVIFGDRGLVRHHINPIRNRTRLAVLVTAALVFGLALGGWTWSYMNNRQYVANVRADLDKAVQLQQDRVDLQSRLEATEVLQDRLQQLIQYREDHPVSMGLGLYQGQALERKLRYEYFAAMRQIMLEPVQVKLELFLGEVAANAGHLHGEQSPADRDSKTAAATASGVYEEADPSRSEDAYNALKAYLMLSTHQHLDSGHLSDQLTRFWRGWLETNRGGMSREQLVRSASRLISFYITQAQEPDWPKIDNSLTLVTSTRKVLREVMRGMPAQERVYADIKARAATRFPSVTVASILGNAHEQILTGSYAISGTFSREAWKGYVKEAIAKAANTELSNSDWVLDSVVQDDLTLTGSPEHIEKELIASYKQEYTAEWLKFLQGISVDEFGDFDRAVNHINLLGDPAESPLRSLMAEVYRQTSWDNTALTNARLGKAQTGFVAWFKRAILRRRPAGVNLDLDVDVPAGQMEIPMGAVGRSFAGVARLMQDRDGQPSLMDTYLHTLGSIRSRFNDIKNQGDPGPGALELMRQTLDGGNSELAEALRLVDEQMVNGISLEQRRALRPLLLRPLMEAYAALIPPTEQEINRVWQAQVYAPFQKNLATKYPFDVDSAIEAAPAEIARLFGPDGAIASFGSDALGPLVVRRGNTLTPRQWADIGINLLPDVVVNYGVWVSPLDQSGVPTASGVQQTTFQIRPKAAYGLTEYSIVIDGQRLRYRNTSPQWSTFVWPVPGGTPGVSVEAVTYDGRNVSLFDAPGPGGLTRLFRAGDPQKLSDNEFLLTWTQDEHRVSVELRLISSPQSDGAGELRPGLRGLQLPRFIAGSEDRPQTEVNP